MPSICPELRHPLLVLTALVTLVTSSLLRGQSYTFSDLITTRSANGLTSAPDGNLYVADITAVWKLTPQGTLARIAGDIFGGVYGKTGFVIGTGYVDATGWDARFKGASGIGLEASGNIIVADVGNNCVRRITPAGVVTTIIGYPIPSTPTTYVSTVFSPEGIALDRAGNIYVSDTGRHSILRITPAGTVTTWAGAHGITGSTDGAGPAARFRQPRALAIDATDNLYVADTGNAAIRKITPECVVTTHAGFPERPGLADGLERAAQFTFPKRVTTDGRGGLFVCDRTLLRRISPEGRVTTIKDFSPTELSAVAVDAEGLVYVSGGVESGSTSRYFIARGVPSDRLTITFQPDPAVTAGAGSPFAISATVIGGEPISYQWSKHGTPVPGATSASLTFASLQTSDAGSYMLSATNATGSVASTASVLTVKPAAANNNFAAAQVLVGASGQTSPVLTGASPEPGEPNHGFYNDYATGKQERLTQSVWYRWTAEQNGTVVFGPARESVKAYTGGSLSTLRAVPVMPEGAANGGPATIHAVAGTTYSIAVSASPLSNAGGDLKWHTVRNDDFALAQTISGGSGEVAGNNSGATFERAETPPVDNYYYVGASVWYRWTAPRDGVAVFKLKNAPSESSWQAAAFSGSTLAQLGTTLARNFDARALGGMAFPVTAGTGYSVKVVGGGGEFVLTWEISSAPAILRAPYYDGGYYVDFGTVYPRPPTYSKSIPVGSATVLESDVMSLPAATIQWNRDGVPLAGRTGVSLQITNARTADSGHYTITARNADGSVTSSAGATLRVFIPPANDQLASALPLAGLTGSISGSNVDASIEPNESAYASVWYRWTAPSSGLATFDTLGTSFGAQLQVLSEADFRRVVAQNYSGGDYRQTDVKFPAVAGTSYYISVASGSVGDTRDQDAFTLNWRLSNTLAVTTEPLAQTLAAGDSVTLSAGSSLAGSTFQWLRNGTAIAGATTDKLTLTNVAIGSDATYTARVTFAGVTVTSAPATIAVATPTLTTLTALRRGTQGQFLWSLAAAPDGLLVAVGTNGLILRSFDRGMTWQPVVSGTTNWLVGVTYGAGQFVAVGDAGTILLSADGLAWRAATYRPTGYRLNNVLYAAGKFVAVGEGGQIVTSPDGMVWQVQHSGVRTWLRGLAYNPSIGHFATSGQDGVFLYSADGIGWTSLKIAGLTEDLEATVAVDNYAQFVAIGENGTVAAIFRNQVAVPGSAPRLTWSFARQNTGRPARLRGLVQGAGALFATGEDGSVITASDYRGPWSVLSSGTTANLLGGLYSHDTLFVVGENETVLRSAPLVASRLVNLSTRGQVNGGAGLMIAGFVINGDRPKQVLVRAVGLALAGFGLPGALSNPVLTLLDNTNRRIATNAGWGTATNAAAISASVTRVGAFPLAAGSADSAALVTLPPGAYTAQISGAANTTGLALVEAYDADPLANDTSRALNLSTRGVAGSDSSKMIAGFVIEGASSRRVLIRAIGPALAAFGVPGTLAEPQLEIYNSRGLLHAAAGEWGRQSNVADIRSAAEATGAFALADGSKDSAMVITLLPGAWTVQVGGLPGTTGVALVEVYVLP